MLNLSSELLRAIEAKAPPPAGPRWVQLEISNRCNTACVFCAMHGPGGYGEPGFAGGASDAFTYDAAAAAWLGKRLATRMMTMELFTAAIDQTLAEGAEDYNLCGLGEPTLNGSYPQMISYVRDRGARVSLDTNGTQLTTVGRVEALIDLGLHGLHVSVNAAAEETYRRVNGTNHSLAAVIEMLGRVRDAKVTRGVDEPHVLLSFVVTRDNYKEIRPFVELAASVGARQAVVDHMVPGGLNSGEVPVSDARVATLAAIEDARSIGAERGVVVISNYVSLDARLQYDIPCIVGYMFTRIMADGAVAGCCGCTHVLGKLPEETFRSIWWGERYRAFRAQEDVIHVVHRPVSSCLCGSCPHVETNREYLDTIAPPNDPGAKVLL